MFRKSCQIKYHSLCFSPVLPRFSSSHLLLVICSPLRLPKGTVRLCVWLQNVSLSEQAAFSRVLCHDAMYSHTEFLPILKPPGFLPLHLHHIEKFSSENLYIPHFPTDPYCLPRPVPPPWRRNSQT